MAVAPHRGKLLPRILLAEEDHEIRALWNSVLDRAGYDVVPCHGPDDLGRVVNSFAHDPKRPQYDLVVCNVRMLVGQLGTAVQSLQRTSRFPPLVVIMAYRGKELLAQLPELAVSAVFDQPFKIRQQLAAVRAIVSEQ